MKKNMYIVISGCGRLGALLGGRLSFEGHSVVIIDRDESAFERLSPDFSGFRIVGDATRIEVLKQAKLDKADVCISVTGSDSINLMVSQTAGKIFAVSQVMARIYDSRLESLFASVGVESVCPTSYVSEVFYSIISNKRSSLGETTL